MSIKNLKIGDRVRITSVPGEGIPDYTIHKDTVRVYKFLIKRGRSVRINEIDEHGQPWFHFIEKRKNGRHHHFMCIMKNDTNWVKVKPRKKG